MKTFLKFLSRNKLYTAIEAVGLAVSLAFVLIIGTSIYDQYRIVYGIEGGENLYYLTDSGAPGMEYMNKLKLDSYPEITGSAAIYLTEETLLSDSGKRRAKIMVADPELLDIVPLNVREGSLDLFKKGDGVILSASAAQKYFPDKSIVGENISLGLEGFEIYGQKGREEIPAVAIVDDPTFTMLADFDVLCPMDAPYRVAKDIRESDLANNGIGRLVGVIARMQPDAQLDVTAYPLRSMYYSSVELMGIRQGKRLYLQILLLLGALLLFSSVLIYMTLGTAVSGSRAKEMATRRLIGATKRDVFRRTIAESVLFTLVCFAIAVLLAKAIVPGLNSIRPLGLTVPFRVSSNVFVIGVSIALAALIGVLAGLVPAKMLSSYRPIDVVSGRIRRIRKMVFNKVCIIVLSFLALILVCLSVTLESQLRHLETMDQGTNPKPDVFFYYPHVFFKSEIRALAERLEQDPSVLKLGYANGIPSHIRGVTAGQDGKNISFIACDSVAFNLLGFRVKEVYEKMIPGSVWISESAKNAFNVSAGSSDISRVFKRTEMNSICGVIEDVRRIADNGIDQWATFVERGGVLLPPAVCIYPSEYDIYLNGILIQTTGNRAEFKERFKKIAEDFYREHSDMEMPEFVNGKNSQCGYLEDIAAADYEEFRRYVRVVEVFTMIALLLSLLGLLSVCTWYASVNSKDIAIRKVFGGTVVGETARNILRYLSYVLAAVAVGTPVAVLLAGRLLENWPDRISGYWWIFAVSALFVLLISAIAILWQTLRAAKTNPAVELKKE